ncbi:MAG TPA: ATP-binding protein [Thermoanaerobaculia bacterium]|jgi:PAS domain S-box-containing protein|nr:ATP-binding protein [Thermoanaerobaculia bacterium]
MLQLLPNNSLSFSDPHGRSGTPPYAAELLIDSLVHAVISTDRTGSILSWNRAAETFYGLSAAAVLGKPLGEAVPKKSPLANPSPLFEAVLAHGQWSAAHRTGVDDGLVLFTMSALRDAAGGVMGFVVASRTLGGLNLPRALDESERLRLENRLLQAERISSLGRLAASVAHEFNNVLMGIQPFIDLLTKRAGHDPAVKLAAPRIADAVARGKRVTQEILRFTRIGDPTRVPIHVAEWLRAFEPELVQLAGPLVTVTTDADPSLTMLADAHQLRQVFANLAVNAHHAMPNGGRLEVRATGDSISDGKTGPGPAVHFSIRDTGVGIPEDTLLYIFEPLFTTKKFGGTGLGLAVASQVVQQHQGHIYAESTLGEGTTFHILIPAASAAPAATPRQQVTPPRVRPAMRLTLVEDDESVGAGLVAVLDFEGITTDWVRLGAEAVPRIAARFPDAVILDLGLPDLDGMQVYEQIAARWPDLPVLFSTGHGDQKLLTNRTNGKKVGYLQKPYESDTLLAALDELLG